MGDKLPGLNRRHFAYAVIYAALDIGEAMKRDSQV
jgi:hypothetical protein